ncbi:MAG: 50S ribosomal protein L28 [Aquificaceae bacterium]|nr:50S ribosomal protein L28 [Aquificaceae bacterium]MCX8060265.1 50S ribosomal protein L28 [Aquificaceae bacterium]MDW8096514.1 50S ribosomal protein L28 [Aquificaceae bacterium]
MARCFVCGKATKFGKSVTFSAEQNSRTFKPNLQRVRVKMPDGSVRRVYVCTKCLKAGKVVKVATAD